MFTQYLILTGLLSYISTCTYFEFKQEYIHQKKIAFKRSFTNFILLHHTAYFLNFNEIPTNNERFLFSDIFIWIILSEVIFTCIHRLFHTKYLFKYHKQHHENNPSYSVSALDAHYLEFLFGNISTVLIPMIIFHGSDMSQLLWIIIATLSTVTAHHFDGPHKIHHTTYNCNYGQGLYLLDRIFGTYKEKN